MRDDFRTRIQKQDDLKGVSRTSEDIDIEIEKRVERIKNQGLTADQVKHRTFAEAHNQLFTDKYHMEASRANSDQGFNEIRHEGVEHTQVRSNILDAKDVTLEGKNRRELQDPEGYGRMWDEKSHFYHDNPAEALAQSKKGIAEMIDLREGQRTQGIDQAHLKPETAQAMEIIIKAPTGSDASPEALERVNQELQSITDSRGVQVYRDTNDAMSKLGRSVEFNKFNISAEQSPSTPSHTGGLSGSDASRISRLEIERELTRESNISSMTSEEDKKND